MENYPSSWLVAQQLGSFRWDTKEKNQGVYIIFSDEIMEYEHVRYNIMQFDACAVDFWKE